ncbi:MAG: hypothetical protein GPOALKHO_000096 [Sodalis sp.]|nr:MAG: hypothetical protein GPOALKHO_000096 [Sodalis sp.]
MVRRCMLAEGAAIRSTTRSSSVSITTMVRLFLSVIKLRSTPKAIALKEKEDVRQLV